MIACTTWDSHRGGDLGGLGDVSGAGDSGVLRDGGGGGGIHRGAGRRNLSIGLALGQHRSDGRDNRVNNKRGCSAIRNSLNGRGRRVDILRKPVILYLTSYVSFVSIEVRKQ